VAPEKIQRKGEDFHSDMYSLGGTLYHALTGHAPFEKVKGEETTVDDIVAAHVHTPLTPPNELVPEITEFTSQAIMRAMAKEPGERYENYEEMQMTLEAARSHLLVRQVQQAGEPEAAAPTKSWWKR
jgi:serine/threonine protein kinase